MLAQVRLTAGLAINSPSLRRLPHRSKRMLRLRTSAAEPKIPSKQPPTQQTKCRTRAKGLHARQSPKQQASSERRQTEMADA